MAQGQRSETSLNAVFYPLPVPKLSAPGRRHYSLCLRPTPLRCSHTCPVFWGSRTIVPGAERSSAIDGTSAPGDRKASLSASCRPAVV
jgi:hypothetical protein